MVLPVFLVESKMGAVVLGFRWLWQSFQIAASVLPTMTRVLSPIYCGYCFCTKNCRLLLYIFRTMLHTPFNTLLRSLRII